MENNTKLSSDDKVIQETPNTPEELFLYYADICDALQRAYGIVAFYREEYKKQIPTPESVE